MKRAEKPSLLEFSWGTQNLRWELEAMTKYNELLGRGPYTTTQEWDYAPYPDEWLQRQR